VYAAKNDTIAICFSRTIGKTEGVPYVVSYPLNLVDLIVVRENNGVALFFKREYLELQRREWFLFPDARVEDHRFVVESRSCHESGGCTKPLKI
jgi:hypothetical protein